MTKEQAQRRAVRLEMMKASLAKDLEGLKPGCGATKYVGSDAYPYYVAEVKMMPNRWRVIGMYEADSAFEHSWTEGTMKTEGFDPCHKPEFWLRLYRNAWYRCDCKGNLLVPHQKDIYSFGYAHSYQNPSF